jgi:hypothetical protein
MAHIILQYQVKSPMHLFENNKLRYEVRELEHQCNPNKSFRENLDDAFDKACELGCEPTKQIRWKFVE